MHVAAPASTSHPIPTRSNHTMKMNLLKLVRQIHLYFGMFIAPSILFFVFTGALQTFSLHEPSRNGKYQPADWIVLLAQIHKKQIAQLPPRRTGSPEAPQGSAGRKQREVAAANPPANPPRPSHNPLFLKIFFVAVSIGICTSTLSGLYMAFKHRRDRLILLLTLLAGIVIPILLVAI